MARAFLRPEFLRRVQPVDPSHGLESLWDPSHVQIVLRAHPAQPVQFLRHTVTGEECRLDPRKGAWTLHVLHEDREHYVTNEVDEDPLFVDEFLHVQLCRETASQRLVLVESHTGDPAERATFLDEYSCMHRRARVAFRLPGRPSEAVVDALIFDIPKQGNQVYLSFYAVVCELLALRVAAKRAPNKWVQGRVPKLALWLSSLGFQDGALLTIPG